MSNDSQSSLQMQNLTVSQEGTSRVAKLQPESHFFIEGGVQLGDFTQTVNESFGALNTTQFRTTASISFSGNKNIYALCMGTVFIQPNTEDSAKVNLIIRPYKQPITGVNIKYIVYRGLNKNDFFNNAGELTGSESSGSGFVKFIWTQFNKYYDVTGGNSVPAFKSYFLGFPHSAAENALQLNDHLIDRYFFKRATLTNAQTPTEEPETAFELPIIPRGMHLGTASAGVGIDIILNDGDYIIENDTSPFKLDLEYARSDEFILDTATVTDAFKKKLLKEASTNFIDVVAFYGLHANSAGKLHVNNDLNTVVTLSAKTDIAVRLQNFNTKHNFYLYIQANRQRSYNFYGNYVHSTGNNSNIKIGVDEDNLSETTFGTNNWPIEVFNITQDPTSEYNTVTFQLTTDSHDDAALFVQIGELGTPHEENFVRNHNLIQLQPDDPAVVSDFNYTRAIQLIIPAIGANNIPAFSNFIYNGKRLLVTTNASNFEQKIVVKDIDDLFGLVAVESNYSFDEASELSRIVGEKIRLLNFSNTVLGKDVGIVKEKRFQDKIQTSDLNTFLNRVTFETSLLKINRSISSHTKNADVSFDYSTSGLTNSVEDEYVFYLPDLPYYLDNLIFADGNTTIIGLILKNERETAITKKILGITNEENNILKSLILSNSLTNTKLFFQNTLGEFDLEYDYNNSLKFKKFSLKIIGENLQGDINIVEPTTPVIVYTLDESIYASLNYGKYAPIFNDTDLYGSLILK